MSFRRTWQPSGRVSSLHNGISVLVKVVVVAKYEYCYALPGPVLLALLCASRESWRSAFELVRWRQKNLLEEK